MRNIGIVVFLLGVLGLIIPHFANVESNLTLGIAAVVMLLGVVLYIVFTKMDIDKDNK